MSDFVHLHLHSEYSLLDGACRISDIPKRAAECGHKAVALTDHGVMYGAVAFYDACVKEGIKPIIGCEVYVAPNSRFDKLQSDGKAHHLVLLCKNETGYKNLIYLVSKGFTEGFYSKPRVDMALLKEHSEGLIALSACLAGEIPSLLTAGDYDAALIKAKEYADIFGKENFYIELQNHGLAEQMQIIDSLVRLADEAGLSLVATNDCHYLRKKDAETQAVLMCIQTNRVINDGRPIGFETDEFYYKTTEEMELIFSKYRGAIENTVKIADACNFEFVFDVPKLPTYPTPNGESADEYLRALAANGMTHRPLCTNKYPLRIYEERLEYELSVIEKMGFCDYFLIVQDYVNFARSKAIPVGPGRGSGAGSLVAYLIGITDVDPIEFDLLFERFLNPERVSMPDFDVDFCYNRREEVISYMYEKYGKERVCQIVAFGTLAARAAVRDVGRALGMPYGDVDIVAKAIPRDHGMTLKSALGLPEIKTLYESSESVKRLLDLASAVEGMPRNITVHAAGLVLTNDPLTYSVPLSVSNGTVVTQFDMDIISKLGLLKFDFLALRYLTIIDDAAKDVAKRVKDFDISKIPIDDKQTYDLISSGNTQGVFQLESSGMRQVLSELRPDKFDDIQAAIALYRPGPMDSIPKYIESRHHPEKTEYFIPELEPILSSTYGCTVYQEQVMSIFRTIAGYSYGHADIVRRAMSKKKADALSAERDSFIAGADSRGIPKEKAEKLFDDMASFANYAFNKSHAAAYAVLSYRTAYLKAHYPCEYMAALMTSVLDNLTKLSEYISECARYGISVTSPNINKSGMYFTADGENILFGLLALKNVGKQFIEKIIEERSVSEFSGLDDFVNRMSGVDLNKRMVEALIKSGAFDGLGATRSSMLASYEKLIDIAAQKTRNNLDGQLDIFSMSSGESITDAFEFPNIPEFSVKEKLMLEKEASGMYFSGHILDSYSKNIEAMRTSSLAELYALDGEVDKLAVTVAAVINSVTLKTTKKNENMAFIAIEDRYAEGECILFSARYAAYSHMLRKDNAVCIHGTLSFREDEAPKIIVNEIKELVENSEFEGAERKHEQKPKASETPKQDKLKLIGNASKIYLRVDDINGESYKKLENLLAIFDGTVSVVVYDKATSKYLSTNMGISLSQYVLREIERMIGEDNVALR